MKRVTGLGGIFFKAADPKKMYRWYEKHLGIKPLPDGSCVIFEWRDAKKKNQKGMTLWSIFPKKTKYFRPSRSPFMLNYRVEDLDALLKALRKERVKIDPRRDDSEFGRFAWITDPEGNRIELWQPPKGH